MLSAPLIQEHVSLSDKNWFGTGGNARYYCEPRTADEFAQALAFAQQHKLEIALLGLGANVLISDEGFNGLLIHPMIKTIHTAQTENDQWTITAGAGITIDELIETCLQNNLLGLEEFSGIPGSVGGSVYINIHYFEYALSQFLRQAVVIDRNTGKIETVDHAWFNFGYDKSRLHDKQHFLVSATFNVRKVSDLETAYAKGRNKEIVRHRKNRYPHKGTCGCFFRNFLDHEVSLSINGKKMIYTAYYLDKLGIKGALSCGDAQVSHQHANMIVNKGAATSNDIVALAKNIQKLVKKEFGVIPQAECQLIGFKPTLFSEGVE